MDASSKRSFDPRSWDHTFELISWWDAESVRKAKVIVVGAGALGNEVLKNLALLNVGHILVIDFDTIEYSNLSRSILFRPSDCVEGNEAKFKADIAAKRVKEINPNVHIRSIVGKIPGDVGLGVFRHADVIIGCLDNRLARLFINRLAYKIGATWVDGGIQNLAGQVTVYRPGESCYECSLGSTDREFIQFQLGCPDIARASVELGRVPTTPLAASIIGALQVTEALKVVLGNDDKLLVGERAYYEGMNNDYFRFKTTPMKSECLSHFTYDPIIEADEMTADLTVKDALDLLQTRFNDPAVCIELDQELITEITTRQTEKTYNVIVSKASFGKNMIERYQIQANEGIVITGEVRELTRSFSRLDLSLLEVGIPRLHIIKVRANGETHFVELSGDEPPFGTPEPQNEHAINNP